MKLFEHILILLFDVCKTKCSHIYIYIYLYQHLVFSTDFIEDITYKLHIFFSNEIHLYTMFACSV